MSDIVSWSQKADALLSFWTVAHNETWDSDNPLISAGQQISGAILLTFIVECALKALLEQEGKGITGGLRTHDVHVLFGKLETETRAKASGVYLKLMEAEGDPRVHRHPTNALGPCLQNHASTFTNWRYDLRSAGKFYHVPMIYAAISLLTFANPTKTYSAGSATSLFTEVIGGRTKRRDGCSA